ncbi:sulfotransferase [Altererythrobacter sp. ZODW24]|uniref:sulfotransferase family protein n=1 Tax=Altererythrobacter sp. ZODW24 TaxID=2185142 RepID=UPI000DF74940|nr:sulfotransferase [Altererythrobacter sp. ZODW24]
MIKADGLHLLVLGSPRSGTTLLSAMLSCHPDVSLLNEELSGASLRIFSKPVQGVKLCAPHQIELEHSSTMKAKNFASGQIRKLTNVVRKAMSRPIPKGGFRKSALSIREYQQWTEQMVVLGIIRSPGQVIESIMKRGNQSRAKAEYRWRRLIEMLYELSQDGGTHTQVKIVHFDQLVRDPAGTLEKALASLGQDFDPAVMEGFQHTPQYRGRTSIDPTRAGPGLEADMRHSLLQQDPELAAKYKSLCEAAL